MSAADITSTGFSRLLSEGNFPVLIDFWAPWCTHCRRIGPAIEEIGKEYDGRLDVARINIDDYPELAKKYGVISIPTLMLFREGEPAGTLVGPDSKVAIVRFLDGNLT